MHSAVLEDRQQTILTTNRAADELKCAEAAVALTYLARGHTQTAAVRHIAQSPLKRPPSLPLDMTNGLSCQWTSA